MATGILQTIRHSVMVIGVCASLATSSLGLAGSAEARVPAGDRLTESAFYCGMYQDMYDKARQDYRNAKSDYARNKAQQDIDRAVNAYYRDGCWELYGGLSALQVRPGLMNNQEAVNTTGEVSPESTPATQPLHQAQKVQLGGLNTFN